jgi:CRP-like cAMP-binding protein
MQDDFTPSEVRLASWLIAAADKLGGFPVDVSKRDIKEGFTRGDVTLQGWGAHYRTIGNALESLEERGYITSAEGQYVGYGHKSRIITITG